MYKYVVIIYFHKPLKIKLINMTIRHAMAEKMKKNYGTSRKNRKKLFHLISKSIHKIQTDLKLTINRGGSLYGPVRGNPIQIPQVMDTAG